MAPSAFDSSERRFHIQTVIRNYKNLQTCPYNISLNCSSNIKHPEIFLLSKEFKNNYSFDYLNDYLTRPLIGQFYVTEENMVRLI